MTEWRKWWQTIQISWSNQMAYKLNFVLMVLGPALVFFFVKYNLWSSIYGAGKDQVIQGYNFQQMIAYQTWVLVIGFIAQGHNSMNLAEDIRMGRISAYLIYPFQFWQFHTANFLGFQVIQVVVALFTLMVVWALGFLPELHLAFLVKGFFYCCLVGFVWFSLQYIAGLLAFWLEETWMIRVLMSIVIHFLSGAVIPLEIFPDWLAQGLKYTPFPYLTYIPAKIFMGEYVESVWLPVSVLGGWLLFFFAFASLIWRRGLRLYTAAGM